MASDKRSNVVKASAILDDHLAPVDQAQASDDRLQEAIDLLQEAIDDGDS